MRHQRCPVELVERDDGRKGFRIQGVLDFSLIGILAGIAEILAENGISIFAISTYNTDYVLMKKESYQKALDILGARYTKSSSDSTAFCRAVSLGCACSSRSKARGFSMAFPTLRGDFGVPRRARREGAFPSGFERA